MTFTQTMTLQADAAEPLAELIDAWHRDEQGSAPGYVGARLLADKDRPGRYVVQVDFSSEAEAKENSDRPETQAWAEKLRGLAQSEPEYHNYEVTQRTG